MVVSWKRRRSKSARSSFQKSRRRRREATRRLDLETLEPRALLALTTGDVTPVPSAGNLVQNGGFEAPVVTSSHKWNVYTGNQIAPWTILSSGNIKAEIQRDGVGGWVSSAASGGSPGSQWLEIDGDENGPGKGWDANAMGRNEQGLYTIRQDVTDLVPGELYAFRFDFAARPGTSQSNNQVQYRVIDTSGSVGDVLARNLTAESQQIVSRSAKPKWRTATETFEAPVSGLVTIEFTGLGANDTFGMFLDNVAIVPAVIWTNSDEPGSCSSCGMSDGGDASVSQSLADGVDAVHNTSTNPHPIVRVATTLSDHFAGAPDEVEVNLTFGGVHQGTVFYSGTGFGPGDEVVFAMQADATGWATGRYDWTMTARFTYGTQSFTRIFAGTQDVISRSDSECGGGFSLPELDRLFITPSGANLVTGDNHAIWFAKTGTTTFAGEAGDLTFSTLVKNGDGTYTLTSATGHARHFSASGLLTSRVDPVGNTRSYAYAAGGKIASITDHAGRVVTFNYSGDRVSSVVDFDGAVTTLAYDGAGRLVSVTQPDPDGAGPQSSPVTTYGYAAGTGLLTTITAPRGEVTTFEYDHARKISKIIQACGGTSTYTMFRSLGVVNLAVHGSSASNPAGLVSAGSYEIRRDEHGFETHVRRDRFGNVVWERDALGNVTQFARSASGLVTQVTRPDPDGAGPLGALVTQFSYDGRGNLTRIVHPDLTEESWTYDPSFSRPTSYTDPLGRTTLWQINPANGLVVSTTDVVGAIDSLLNGETDDVTTSFSYTTLGSGVPAGLVSTMTDALGRVTSLAYTSRGLLASMTQAVGTSDATTTSFEYDGSDNLTAVIDGIGRRTEYAYDNLDRLTTLTQADPDGAGPASSPVWQFAYDAGGNRTSMTDPLGNVTEYVYDERGRLTSVIQPDPDGAGPLTAPETEYDFDCVGNLVSLSDALSRETSYEYDGLRRMVRAILPDPDGAGPSAAPTVEMAYNNVGWVTSATDPNGNATSYVYDAMGRVVSIKQPDPDGAGPLAAPVTSFTYDAAGQVLSVTDPLGRITSYTYDDLGRITSVTQPDPDGAGPLAAPQTFYAYDKLGNVTSITDPLGNVTLYAYDNLDRLTQITEADPDGAGPLTSPLTTYTFDAASQVIATTDPLGRTTTFEYDNLGRLTKRTSHDPDGAGPELAAWMVYTYNAVGMVLTESDRLGNTTSYTYDNLYRVTKVTDANGKDTLFAYDSVGNRLSLTDSVGNTTQWVYDDLDRVIEEENELGDSRYFVYDVASRLIERTDRNGRVTQFTYDNLNRQTSETWLSGATVVHEIVSTYDVASQLVGIGDGAADYAYQYDGLGRVTQWTTDLASLTDNVVLNQTFDAASRRTSLFATLGATADFKNDFGYDALNRLTSLTQQGQAGGNAVAEKRINFKYLADGRTSEISRYADLAGTQNVANTAFAYDDAGRLTAMTHAKGATTFADYGWAYDAANRMTAFTNAIYPSEDAAYTHDATGQLLGATRSDPADDESYVYDDNGNRVTANGASYATGLNNRIESDGTNSYTYDAEGNITRITNIATGEYRDLAWDHRNRLVKVTQFDSADAEQWRVEYVYDAFNRLTSRTEFTDGSPTATAEDIFIYDGYQMILKLDASGNVQSRTLWGESVDQILAIEDASGNVTWPLTDHLNTVRDIVSYDSGTDTTTLENHIVYDSFGNVVSEANPSVASDLKFTARYTDAATGLQWNLNRWYSPSIGRWMSEDPIGFAAGDPNLMRYVANEPTEFVDPDGLYRELHKTRGKKSGKLGTFYQWETYDVAWGMRVNSTFGPLQFVEDLVPGIESVGAGTMDACGKRATIGSAAGQATQVIEAGIVIAMIGIPGPEDAVVAAARTIGYDILKIGGKWAIQKSGRILTGAAEQKAVAEVSAAVAKVPSRAMAGADDFAKLPARGAIDPNMVRFSQDSIDSTFKNGDSVAGLSAKIRGGMDTSAIPPIRIVVKDGKVFTLDNRRLKAFQEAGVPIRYEKLEAIPKSEMFKFTTDCDGMTIVVRPGGGG